MGTQYFAGYVTEEALSVDNLFVFLLLLGSFKVPRADQQKVLLVGIAVSLVARTGFIFAGRRADRLVRLGVLPLRADPAGHRRRTCCASRRRGEDEAPDNIIIRVARRVLRTSDAYDGDKLFTYQAVAG